MSRPMSAYSTTVPELARRGVTNVFSLLSPPSEATGEQAWPPQTGTPRETRRL